MGRVSGKVAIVTGAAQGLGEATARLLAAEGAAVVLADLQEKGEQVAASIRDSGGQAAFMVHDVTDEGAWARLVDATVARFDGLHVLVNNAGASAHNNTNPENAGLPEWQQMIDANLKSVFLGIRAAIPAMHKTGQECAIVNLSSIHGLKAAPRRAPYGAAKAGVRLYTKSVAVYCGQQGYRIRCNSIHPGYLETPMLKDSFRRSGDEDEQRRIAGTKIPLGHTGQPSDIAYAVLYLASDESRYVTGIELPVDGGLSAQ